MRSPGIRFASALASEMAAFVDAKRALGRRYANEERALRLFDRFVMHAGVGDLAALTPELIDAFLASRPRHSPRSYNHLLGVIRGLFDWLVRQECLDRSPVRATPRRATRARIPCILDPAAVARLLALAAALPDRSRAPLRGPTYHTIFALLYGLGLRVGEASRLCRSDLDFARAVLVVRDTKFGKSRLVPFGPRLGRLLRGYLELRGAALADDAPLFSFTCRGAVHPCTVSQTFHRLVPQLGLALAPGVSPPRVHDLRHAFAVSTLARWYRAGVDPAARLFHLATFLGHVNPSSTAVYLDITPELFALANRRFEGFAAPVAQEVTR